MRLSVKILFYTSLLLSMRISLSQDYSALKKNLTPLYRALSLSDSAARSRDIDIWWTELQNNHFIPLTVEDSVVFFYRGNAKTVEWMGDFNGWGYKKEFNNKGTHIAGTNIWMLKTSFPSDARMDYKILVNGRSWILDPENIYQQWSGVGGGSPNSELRMPRWKEDPLLKARPDIAHGKVLEELLFNSKVLGYQISYSVYLPAGIKKGDNAATLYVTDGYEYLHPRMGNMVVVLDNLLADHKIRPVVAIFIDQREPVNRTNNKRMDELAMNPKYLEFFSTELIPYIESTYPVSQASDNRAIMGASMGGLNAAYFAFTKPGVFGLAGIQSPAFAIRPQIYTLCNNPEHPIKVSMTSGVISDASDASIKMKGILQTNACGYTYHEVNDGHSWGNWRNLIDDVLIDLLGN